MSAADEGLGLGDVLAAALADAEKLAEDKERQAQRDQVQEVLQEVAPEGEEAHVGPDIRGLAAEKAAPRPEAADASLARLRAMGQQLDEARRQLEEERASKRRVQRQLEEVRNDLKATRQRFRRLADQQEELQRRSARQGQDLPMRVRKQLLKSLLPALDSLDAVSRNLLDDTALSDASRQAVTMLRTEWDRALQGAEVTPFDAAGQRFDPVVHEAISEVESADVPAGMVVRQVGRGYLLAGQLLRSAPVVVARAGDSSGDE